jgi:hypothetical protein
MAEEAAIPCDFWKRSAADACFRTVNSKALCNEPPILTIVSPWSLVQVQPPASISTDRLEPTKAFLESYKRINT